MEKKDFNQRFQEKGRHPSDSGEKEEIRGGGGETFLPQKEGGGS